MFQIYVTVNGILCDDPFLIFKSLSQLILIFFLLEIVLNS